MFMVISATSLDGKSTNRARCFETNAVNIPTKGEAELEAARRNKIERAAGHGNVEWYSCPMFDAELQAMAGRIMARRGRS